MTTHSNLKLAGNTKQFPQLVPKFILEQFAAGQESGCLQAITLSADISGFTALTETLFKYHTDGAEVLGETLEAIFSPLVKEVHACGGLIPLYAGDSFTAVFAVQDEEPAVAAQQIWKLAQYIQDYFTHDGQNRLFPTPHGEFAIGIKVGLAFGPVYWGIPGRDKQYTFYFRGPAISQAITAQKQGNQGAIVVHHTLCSLLEDSVSADPNDSYLIIPAHKKTKGAPIFPQQTFSPLPRLTATQLKPFVPLSILNLPVKAEFREICPVFISFSAPSEESTLHNWVTEVMTVVQRYGGTFGQLEFDDQGGILVLWFGAPVSYENNTARAAECLLAIQARQNDGNTPRWQAGLTYGLVWAGLRGADERREYGALGAVVNSAARIAVLAKDGEIWLDEQAASRLQANYQLQPLGLRALKGIGSAYPIYQLMAPKTELQIMFRGNMVGRQSELEQLLLATTPIFQKKFAGISYVYGDAGMGKSRLVFELHQLLARWANSASCPADEILRQSLNPFRHFLRGFFSQAISHALETERKAAFNLLVDKQLEKLASSADPRAAGLSHEMDRTRSLLAALLDIYWPDSLYEQLTPQLRSENTFIAVITLFRALSLDRPVVIHIEDAHWLDIDSQRLLTALCRQLNHYPVAMICTSRYLDDGTQPRLLLSPETPRTILHLQTLSQPEIRKIAEQLLNFQVDTQIIELLAEKSNGQPFFAEQFILDLQERGYLQKQNGRYILNEQALTYLPSSLNALLVARLDRLAPAVKQVVQVASILGERFSVPVLAAILEQDEQLLQNVQTAMEKQIWTLVDELRYLFKHALLRDAAYRMQLHSRRRHLHRLAAETLEQLYAPNLAAHYEQIAYHYAAAHQQGLSEVQHKACNYLFKAGQQTFENFEHETALRHLDRALELSPQSEKERRYEIVKLREQIYDLLNERSAQSQDLQILSKMAEENQFPEWQVEIALRQAKYATAVSNYKDAITQSKQAIKLARKNNNMRGQVLGYLSWARAQIWQRNFIVAQEPLSQAHKITKEHHLIDLEAEILRDLGYINSQLGDYTQGKAYTQQALAICQEIGNRAGEGANLGNLGGMYQDQGYYTEAQVHMEAALALFQQMGNRLSTAINLHGLGELTCRRGNYQQSQNFFRQALALYREADNKKLESAGLYWLGLATFYQGEHEEARHYLESALALAAGGSADKGDAHYGLGKTLAVLGELEEAAEHLEQAITLRRQAGYTALALEALALLAQVTQAQGRQNQALEHVNEIIDYIDNGGHLDGTEAPFQIYLICYQILQSTNPFRANKVLEQAFQQLKSQADRLQDEDERLTFLHGVSWHDAIVEEWKRLTNPITT